MKQDFVIDVKQLNKSFADNHVIKDISLQVKHGEIFGFLGSNGSGKTTTIRLLCGLLTPDSGNGTCLDYDILTHSDGIRRHVGYMTQHFSLYVDLTVRENLRFVAQMYAIKNYKQRVDNLLQQLAFGHYAHQLAGTLSGGWKQRLSLAAALLHNPKLLLLDEPTAGVDPKARRDFWDHIHQLATHGITTLVSTHYMDEAERCHRLAYVSGGRLLVHGTMKDIIAHAHLTTWEVTGTDLASLAHDLKQFDNIEQVVMFGTRLHVSAHDADMLEKTIQPFMKPPYIWRKVEASLEDVFINLVGK